LAYNKTSPKWNLTVGHTVIFIKFKNYVVAIFVYHSQFFYLSMSITSIIIGIPVEDVVVQCDATKNVAG